MSGQRPRHTPERAARLLRVSGTKQEEAQQEPSTGQWITDHGYLHVKDYVLHAQSAFRHTKKVNAMWDAIVHDMQNGEVDIVILWQSSRGTRQGAYSAFELQTRVRKAGGRIEYVEDSFLNETNEMSDVMLAWVATKDRAFSLDKQKATLRTHANIRKNKGFIGRPCYGWRLAGEKYNKKPTRCDEEAAVFREAKDLYLNRGQSLDEICDAFNAEPDKYLGTIFKGERREWQKATLSDLFRNPAMAGRFYWTFDGEKVCVQEYQEENAIISWEDHLALVARLDSRAHRKGISPANVFMLTGRLTDPAGHRMNGKGPRTSGSITSYYACRMRGCALHMPMAEVNAEVTRQIMWLYGDLPFEIRKVTPGENWDDEIARKRQDLRELEPGKPEDEARRPQMLADLAELRSRQPKRDKVEWVPSGKTIAEHWEELDLAARRDWLEQVDRTFTAHHDDKSWWLTTKRESSVNRQAALLGTRLSPGNERRAMQREETLQPVKHPWSPLHTARAYNQ